MGLPVPRLILFHPEGRARRRAESRNSRLALPPVEIRFAVWSCGRTSSPGVRRCGRRPVACLFPQPPSRDRCATRRGARASRVWDERLEEPVFADSRFALVNVSPPPSLRLRVFVIDDAHRRCVRPLTPASPQFRWDTRPLVLCRPAWPPRASGLGRVAGAATLARPPACRTAAGWRRGSSSGGRAGCGDRSLRTCRRSSR